MSKTAILEEQETLLRSRDGLSIFVRAWIPEKPERVVVCIQGLGGHGGYYNALADYLVPQGTVVVAPDLRGHGRSEGMRGDIESFHHYLEDVDAAVRWGKATWPDVPLIVLGESMGSSLAIQYCAQQRGTPLAGLALISPVLGSAIQPKVSEAANFLRSLVTNPRRPTMSVTGREELGCRLNEFNDRLRADPLFVRHVSVRFLIRLSGWLRQSRGKAGLVTLPLLVLQGGKDYVAHRPSTRLFLRRVSTKQHHLVTFPEAYHCLLYDPETPEVMAVLNGWLTAISSINVAD